ncbi:hypothetical protein D3OALGA1CA_5400 [Olavius algarvensis associated proteobacterium Delta 3]|nr:hypothetical protein D3OALGB2SA_1546 [Olavius algarvensis associated proteobacterium Delta 3]CAB5166154.1 hypothetical protein D3OALGA1CA_5400 [Olavius algarvensis associated proteobacterium Delta 3]
MGEVAAAGAGSAARMPSSNNFHRQRGGRRLSAPSPLSFHIYMKQIIPDTNAVNSGPMNG